MAKEALLTVPLTSASLTELTWRSSSLPHHSLLISLRFLLILWVFGASWSIRYFTACERDEDRQLMSRGHARPLLRGYSGVPVYERWGLLALVAAVLVSFAAVSSDPNAVWWIPYAVAGALVVASVAVRVTRSG